MPNERILLVEDNPMNRRVAEFLLKSHGYVVYEARDGQEALELTKIHLPNLILMDLQLPGLDGYATTRIIKQDSTTKDIPIVALTAYAMTGDTERALEAGCDGYITKPIDPDQFPATVAHYLKHPLSEKTIQTETIASTPKLGPASEKNQLSAELELPPKTKMNTIGEVADVLHHEVQNLTGAFQTSLEILRKNPNITGADAELLTIIQTGSNRLNEIVSEFSTFGHPQPPQHEAIKIHELIGETLSLLQRDDRCSSSIVIHRRLDPSVHDIKADRKLIGQLLWHILLNAVQAMVDDGHLDVETQKTNREIKIMVRDTGPGIAITVLPKIFDPLFTTKSRGLGLGLAIARRVVEEHNGQISVQTQQGKGSCFTVVLPLNAQDNSNRQ